MFCCTLWRILYVAYIYQFEGIVYEGIGNNDEELGNYSTVVKKTYIYFYFWSACAVIVLFIIFYFACDTWEDMGEDDKEEEKENKEDDKEKNNEKAGKMEDDKQNADMGNDDD